MEVMIKLSYIYSLCGVLILSLASVSAGDNNLSHEQYLNISPAEVHRILAEMKAGSLERRLAAIAMSEKRVSLYDQANYDVLYYNISLNVNVEGQVIEGVVMMMAKVVSDGEDTIEIDLFSNMTVDSVYNESSRLNFLHADDKIIVELDQIYGTGETFTVIIAYNGTPVSSGLYGFGFDENAYGDYVASSLSEPMSARSWWPCKDRPDDKADSLDISITCDTAYYCVSNGTLIDTIVNGDGNWTFNYQVRYPIAAYLFSIAIADYAIWTDWYYHGVSDSMPVIHHVYPENLTLSLANYAFVPDAITIFSDLFGEYPFINEKYGHANFEWHGAMEHQTVSSMTGSSFGFNEYVIVHELAHQWWGDMITCRNWHEIWLNEGFASYSEALFYEARDGEQAYHDYIATLYTYFEGRTVYVYDTTDVGNIFNSVVYDKGAWVLHMLRHVVGDADFFQILQTYYSSVHAYGTATTDEFKYICEVVSGLDLDYFFNEWVYNAYFPHYHWSYFSEPDLSGGGGYYTYFHLRQGASTSYQVFSMPIDLVFTTGKGLDTIVVFNNCEDTVYILKTDDNPTSVELDPYNWVMKWSLPEDWTYYQIPFGLGSGHIGQPYLDSIVVRGGNGDNRFSITAGSLPSGLQLDEYSGHISGTPNESGLFSFNVYAYYVGDTISDTREYSLYIISDDDLPGDVNNNGVVNLLDITYIITYLYKGGPAPAVPEKADVNNSCTIDILDITYLIMYLYKGGPEPLWGCTTE